MGYKDKEKQRAYQALHYQKNKLAYDQRLRVRRTENQVKLMSVKESTGCSLCGIRDWRCLDFHHREEATKGFAITEGVKSGYAWSKIEKEMTKCDVLCANCHRLEHAEISVPNPNPRVIRNQQWYKEYRQKQPCKMCGCHDWRVLCCHHEKDKTLSISSMVNKGYSVDQIESEVAKCTILCLNCHRKLHMGNVWDMT